MAWIDEFPEFARTLIHIRDKDGRLQKLALNAAQRRYFAERGKRNIVLKARQQGFSTAINARQYHEVCTIEGFRAVIVSHKTDATMRLKKRVNLMHERMPFKPRAEYNSTSELSFNEMGSSLYIGTAGGRAFGRGDTVHHAHLSEFAFYPNGQTLLAGLQEAVPANGQIDIESTPNGYNDFYAMWEAAKRGENGYTALFFPWFLHTEYATPTRLTVDDFTNEEQTLAAKALKYGVTITPAQIEWRRTKKQSLKAEFAQEYPEDDATCFLMSGTPRFEIAKLNALLASTRAPVEERRLGNTLVRLRVYEPPKDGLFYVIGADSAEGRTAGDNNSADILDWETGNTVATLHGKCSPYQFADMLAETGRRYFMAALGVELNHPGPAVMQRLVEGGYPNLFVPEGATDPGWRTNAQTRPVMVDELDEFICVAGADAFPDETQIKEMMAFQIGASGKAEAAQGAHDDTVMAKAIALMVRKNTRPPRPEREKKARWGRQV